MRRRQSCAVRCRVEQACNELANLPVNSAALALQSTVLPPCGSVHLPVNSAALAQQITVLPPCGSVHRGSVWHLQENPLHGN